MQNRIKMLLLIVLYVFSITTVAMAYSREVPFTQDDRDRLIRLETRVEENHKSLQQQINDLKQSVADLKRSIEDLRSFTLTGFGILLMGMFTLVGFVLWDRRTALAPAVKKSKELEEREEYIEKALKEYAKVEPRLAEIMKSPRMM